MNYYTQFKSVSAIWGSESKSVSECATRVLDFILLLQKQNPSLFGTWYETANSLENALKRKVVIDHEYFSKLVEKKWDKKFPQLGAGISLWNGNVTDGNASAITFSIGSSSTNPNIHNSCVVSLPIEGEGADYYKVPENQKKLIELMNDFWKPNFLLVNGEEIPNLLRSPKSID